MLTAKIVAFAAAVMMAQGGPESKGPAESAGLLALANDPTETHGGPTANGSKALGKSEQNDAAPEAKPVKKAAKPAAPAAGETAKSSDGVDADAALNLLTEGNQRWVEDKPQDPSAGLSRRQLLAEQGQKPFATIITCADSRLPVERLFDRGVGELFVIRVAGNVAGESETGTIEYGVGHLKTPLLVVMGHTKCGAVAAAAGGAELHGSLGKLVARVGPAVERARRGNPGVSSDELPALAIRENVWQTMFDLFKSSEEVRSAVRSGELRVIGAVCDLSTGKVNWMGEHPWQAEIITALDTRTTPSNEAQAAAGEGH